MTRWHVTWRDSFKSITSFWAYVTRHLTPHCISSMLHSINYMSLSSDSATVSVLWDMTHSYVTWLIHIWHDAFICDMTHWIRDVTHNMSFSRGYAVSMQLFLSQYLTWLNHMGHMTHIFVTWRIYMWHGLYVRDMTHVYVTWLIYTCRDSHIRDMTHSYETKLMHTWHDSLYVTWLTYTWHDLHVRDMTHIYVNDSHIRDMTYVYVTWLI